jgi:hypothetical protein
MMKIFIIFFIAIFGPTINGQSTNPFTPYCDELTALLPQIQSSTVNVTCTTPLIQDTQIDLHYCTTFMTSTLSASTTATFLATISGLTAQIQGLYAACIAGSENTTTTTTTTSTTLPPDVRLTLLPQFDFIISNLTSLFNVSSASSASSCCLQPIKNDIDFLVSWTQTLKSGILSQSYGLEMSYIESLYSNIQQLYSNFTDCQTVGNCCNLTTILATTTTVATTTVTSTSTSTTTTTTIDPRIALGPLAQQLLASLNALLLSMKSYNGSQAGVPSFVINATLAVNQTQDLISIMFTIEFSICSGTLTNLQNWFSQLAAAWAAYCINDVPTTLAPTTIPPTTLAPTTEAPTTIDPRIALDSLAQQLLANLNALLQSMQSYNGSQAGVPLFVSNATAAATQIQSLITNMLSIDFSIGSTTFTNLESLLSQLSAAWASYCANDVPTTISPTTLAPTTEIPTTLVPTTEVPTTLAPTTIPPTTETPTTIDPRLALGPLAQQLLANLTALLQNMQRYPGSQAGVPLFIINATLAVNQTQNLISIMFTIEFSICSATLTSLENWLSQLAAAWASYCANDVPTTLAPTTEIPTTEIPTTEVPTTEVPTTEIPTTEVPTTLAPTTEIPTTLAPTTEIPTTLAPTTEIPTTLAPTTIPPTTLAPTTIPPTTLAPTTIPPTTLAPTTIPPTTLAPTESHR